jgi:metal-responsive CopG/Arc/MetJ family transcriptional regulator
MRSEKVRLNITIPKPLAQELEKLTQNKSDFIAEALASKIKELRKQKLKELLTEGYKATAREAAAISGDFEAADLEGLDEN